jgi:fucose 4-O-acetylase-like acetyltransferase
VAPKAPPAAALRDFQRHANIERTQFEPAIGCAGTMAFAAAPADPAARDPWLDNARFALIALVVFGHLLEPLLASHPLLGNSYRFIYSFHMPAFAFLSGAVSRPRLDDRLLRGVLFRLLLPYLVFQGLYALAAQWPGWPDDGPDGVVTPYWLLWYLLSLAGWRLLLPLFARLRWRLPIAVAVALGAGCSGHIGYVLSLSRTLVFFPLFLLGWQLAPQWRRHSGPVTRILAVGVLAGLFAVAATSDLDPRWLYGSYGYAELGAAPIAGAALRLLLLGCAMAGTCAFLALMPRRRLPVTTLGTRSLGAYVLQGFAINLAIGAGVFAALAALPRAALLPMLLAMAAVAAAALSARPVQRALAPITAPRWLERRLWRS